LGYKDQEGSETVVNILGRELSRAMILAGVERVEDIRSVGLEMAQSPFGLAKL